MSSIRHRNYGSILALVAIILVVLTALGLGILTVAYGVRHQALATKNDAAAMMAAEAGYESAVFWMGQQSNLLYVMKTGGVHSGSVDLSDSNCDYNVSFFTFIGSRAVYRIVSNGHSGMFTRTVDVLVVQAVGGWDMGMCRIPGGPSSTSPVYYVSGEVIDMPIHINKLSDSPDVMDIYISGNPQFLREVAMGESRYTSGGSDKYAGVMGLFQGGIYFDQPDSMITNEATVQSKVDSFRECTKTVFQFTPNGNAPVALPHPAVQLEFFVDGGLGKVRITNNCTVRGYNRGADDRTHDFKIKSGSGGSQYERYDIYAYHVRPNTGLPVTNLISDTYVTQSIGGVQSEPGGQIFVNGNVIIGSGDYSPMVIKGKITVVAAGNIWIANSIAVEGSHDTDGRPSKDNPNVLGLIAQGVIKIIDPGMTDENYGNIIPAPPANYTYVPVGLQDGGQPQNKRHLPNPTVVEAAVTVGGGGWGAENVRKNSYGDRKEWPITAVQNDLFLYGAITEAIRGVVGQVNSDGYIKHYYVDERLLEGILPGDIWLKGKYIPTPAGWHDYRPNY